jgi:hypothetical protein
MSGINTGTTSCILADWNHVSVQFYEITVIFPLNYCTVFSNLLPNYMPLVEYSVCATLLSTTCT